MHVTGGAREGDSIVLEMSPIEVNKY